MVKKRVNAASILQSITESQRSDEDFDIEGFSLSSISDWLEKKMQKYRQFDLGAQNHGGSRPDVIHLVSWLFSPSLSILPSKLYSHWLYLVVICWFIFVRNVFRNVMITIVMAVVLVGLGQRISLIFSTPMTSRMKLSKQSVSVWMHRYCLSQKDIFRNNYSM